MQAETDVLTHSQTGCWVDKNVMCGCGENPALNVSREIFIGTTLHLWMQCHNLNTVSFKNTGLEVIKDK